MSDYLIPALTGFDNLNILSKEASRYIEDQLEANPAVTEKFSVEFTLSGAMTFLGDQIRTTYELTDITKQEVIWHKTDDRPVNDFFGLQDQIGAEVLSVFDKQVKNLTFGGLSTPDEVKLKRFKIFSEHLTRPTGQRSVSLISTKPIRMAIFIISSWLGI